MCTKFSVSGRILCVWTNFELDYGEGGEDRIKHRLSFKKPDYYNVGTLDRVR